jgi:hypothetical protein
MRVDQLLEISNALELPATYFFGLHERLNQEEIITYNKQIEELEKSNKELLKTVNFLTETLRVEIEESKKLLRAVTILFISEDKEEAEKARQMLVSLVRFYDTDNKLLRGIRGNKNISKKDQKRNSF